MKEGQKFLRYVIPAFIYFVELILFLIIFSLFDSNVRTVLTNYGDRLTDKGLLNITITGFILSGGLGAFFCQIYHFFYSFQTIDLRKLIIDALDNKYLKIIMNGKILTAEEINNANRRVSLMIDTVMWSQRRLLNKKIEGADERTEVYHSHMHSLGAIIIATFFAYISLVTIAAANNCHCELIIFSRGAYWFNLGYFFIYLFWLVLTIIFSWSCRKVRRELVFHRYSILMDVLKDDFRLNNDKPVEVVINSIDRV